MHFFFNNFLITVCDAPVEWQFGIQEPATPAAEGIIHFHNYLMYYIIIICVLVFWLLYQIIVQFNSEKNNINDVWVEFVHSSTLEIIWTITPAVVLLLLAVPSFALLYSLDELIDPDITLKIIGNQWFWSYEYTDYVNALESKRRFRFDSYMVPTQKLYPGDFRLLEVDSAVVLPTNTHIRLLITAVDVLHSWAVPALGLKVDACPGRLTQASLFIKREGLFFGQCSEICGVNHGFMPICVRSLSLDNYMLWISSKIDIMRQEDELVKRLRKIMTEKY